MKAIIFIALLALATTAYGEAVPQVANSNNAAEPGRTDGPEGSEYGKGGYWHNAQYGRFYTEGFMGSASVDIEGAGLSTVKTSQTDIIAGLNAVYMIEDWLAFQLGFAHISDQDINLYSGGIRSAYATEPFNYYFSLDAEIFSPSVGGDHFGIVPGVGAEVILTNHLRVGLRFQRDFIFADDTIKINKFTAKVQLDF